jgi:hypothetical protein
MEPLASKINIMDLGGEDSDQMEKKGINNQIDENKIRNRTTVLTSVFL